MRADLFYQSLSKTALPLVLVTKVEWETGLSDLTNSEHNYLNTLAFQGQLGDVCLINDADGFPTRAYVGVTDYVGDNERIAIANAAMNLPAGCYHMSQPLSRLAMLTWSLAQYCYDEYKKQDRLPRVLCLNEDSLEAICCDAMAIFLIRDLINKPSNALSPSKLAQIMANIANHYGAEFREWSGNELLSANFPAIHTVGRAGSDAPRLLCLTWGNLDHPAVTLVGKGVCFDSGGLDIKPSTGMRLMKKDMGGAAHVLGLAQWIMANHLPIRLQVLIPAVENMIASNAYKPGDIVTMRNGLTVEIENTDAEGRLILADALTLASETNPELIINFATLTGAARVAVGTEIAAMFTDDDILAHALMQASKEVSDPIWRLPLFAPYEAMLDSSVADVANASPVLYAGAITAALFLKRFVPSTLSWVHFDIMAWNVSSKPGKPEGGEAMGMRAVAYYLYKKYGANI